MSTHTPSRRSASKRRNVHVLNSLSEQPRPHGLPAPRDIFMLWLMMLPDGANKSAAARQEIARLDAATVSNSDTEELKSLLLEVTSAS